MDRSHRVAMLALAAAGVAALSRRRARVAAPAELLAPLPPPLPPGRLVLLPGRGEVFVRDTGPGGSATPVLLLHGWTATADVNFFPVYAALAPERRVLAVDHRGHGRGMRSELPFTLTDCADDAAALLRELEVPAVIAVGYSMGGPIAMLLARRHPELVRGLVVQATALEWSGQWWERQRWRGLALLELALRTGTGESALARVLSEAERRRPELRPLRPWLASEFRRGDPAAVTQAGRELAGYDARPWAGGLGLPAAAVITAADRMVPPRKQRALARALAATVVELAADHDAPLLAPAAFAEATAAAVAAVDGGQRGGRRR